LIWTREQGKAYAVADTGVSISLTAPSSDVFKNGRFVIGDRIQITCPGITTRELKTAVYHAENSESIRRWHRSEWDPTPVNRLMNPVFAEAIVASANSTLPWPFWQTEGKDAPLLTSLVPGQALFVALSKKWPNEPNFSIAHYLQGWTMNTATMRMTLFMRSGYTITASPVAAEDEGLPVFSPLDWFAPI
jgi:hypothetical protein